MPLNSVQQYLQTVFNGLAVPAIGGTHPAVQAIIGPTPVGTPKGPQVYVRVRRFTQVRKSGPPGEGTLELTHDVVIIARWQIGITRLLEAKIDPAVVFTAFVDTIILALNAQPKAHIRITDPYTGKKSELGLIGEAQSGELRGPWAVQDQRAQLYGAELTAIVRELMRG